MHRHTVSKEGKEVEEGGMKRRFLSATLAPRKPIHRVSKNRYGAARGWHILWKHPRP
jgi:hypothetical protein